MTVKKREDQILSILNKENSISISNLCRLLHFSRSTIRRDLIKLENDGFVRRYHGGVTLIDRSFIETSYIVRKNENKQNKIHISSIASRYLNNNMVIFMDSSSTVEYLCPYLSDKKKITIVTNNLNLALNLSNYEDIKIIITPGIVKTKSVSIISELTSNFLKDFYVDISFMSCKSFNYNGIFEGSISQAQIKKNMIRNSKQVMLLADSSKIGIEAFYKSLDYGEISCFITDREPSEGLKNLIEKSSCKLLY